MRKITKKRNISSSKKRVKQTRKVIKGDNKKTRNNKKNKDKTQKVARIKRNSRKTRKSQKGGGKEELLKTLLEKDGINISKKDINRIHRRIESMQDFKADNELLKEKIKFVREQIDYVKSNMFWIPKRIVENFLKIRVWKWSKKDKIESDIKKIVIDTDPDEPDYENELYKKILESAEKDINKFKKKKEIKIKDKITELKTVSKLSRQNGIEKALEGLGTSFKKLERDIALYRLKYEHMKLLKQI
jgi:hypothetical protein